MAKRDYYEVLHLKKGASEKEIKAAYRKLARTHHPDVNPGNTEAEAQFKEISEAYQVLSDPQKRAIYDRFGHQAFRRDTGHGQSVWDFSEFDFNQFSKTMGFDASGLGNLFGSFFGGQQHTPKSHEPVKGKDIQYAIDLSFEDVLNGLQTKIMLQHVVACSHCKGKKTEPGYELETCTNCQGTGRVKTMTGFLNVAIPQICPQCQGSGTINRYPCHICHGKGVQQQTDRISVKIPAGADNGTKVRVAGKGHAGENGGRPGDLYIITRVQQHPFFERRGDNLYCEVPITITEAVLGAKLMVPTHSGDASMILPAGTQSGQIFRLRGKGIPHMKGAGRGDLFVTVKVVTPQNVDTRTSELFREIARLHPENPRERLFPKAPGASAERTEGNNLWQAQ
ncbi:MAG: molecular chaperone DnaJ [Candidatus Vecturithrix sp.]|jgi:molecular chaperone DnaJ|nr:molecular chaperone DnaJ [Candidatus Vecturithrix sp.]